LTAAFVEDAMKQMSIYYRIW